MTSPAINWRLETHASLPSTNDLCREKALAGAPEGLAIRAETQTAGRGTKGRTWASPKGNLYLSILLRPSIPLRGAGQLSLLAGLATAEALQPHTPHPIRLKWPNDLLIHGAKLAGILVESAATGTNLDFAIIGIGANLATAPSLPDRPTTSLAGALSPHTATHAILARLSSWCSALDLPAIRAAWETWSDARLDENGQVKASKQFFF